MDGRTKGEIMDRIERIKNQIKLGYIIKKDKLWLVSENERLRKVIENELNRLKYFVDSDSVKAQQILLKALKEGDNGFRT